MTSKLDSVNFSSACVNSTNYSFLLGTGYSLSRVAKSFYFRFGFIVNRSRVDIKSASIIVYLDVYSFAGVSSNTNLHKKFQKVLEKNLQIVFGKGLPVKLIINEVFAGSCINENLFIPAIFGSASQTASISHMLSSYIKLKLERESNHNFALDQVFKECLGSYSQGCQSIKGMQIKVKGRINGSDRSKKVSFSVGKSSKQTFQSPVDYSFSEAFTAYGVIGVKVWVVK